MKSGRRALLRQEKVGTVVINRRDRRTTVDHVKERRIGGVPGTERENPPTRVGWKKKTVGSECVSCE